MSQIQKIVIHCSATQNGRLLHNGTETAATIIDKWHKRNGFHRSHHNIQSFNSHLKHIGYQFVIDCDGTIETGRQIGEIGAHVKGYNKGSIGICLVGGLGEDDEKYHGRFTAKQWHALYSLLQELSKDYPNADIYGHRDLSPDLNGDGSITPNEWLKYCPCFDVTSWLENCDENGINYDHLFE